MPCRTLEYSTGKDWPAIEKWMDLRKDPDTKVDTIVHDILASVKEHGDKTLVEYTCKFDCKNFTADMLRVSAQAIKASLDEIPDSDIAILEEAISRVRISISIRKRNHGGPQPKTARFSARWSVPSTVSDCTFPADKVAKHHLSPASS